MLTDIRDRMQKSNLLKAAFVVIVGVPFALFGINYYIQGSVDNSVATVNDREISAEALQTELRRQQNEMRELFQGQLPNEYLQSPFLVQQSLERLIERELIRSRAEKMSLATSDIELAEDLRNTSAFQTEGIFDFDLFERQLQAGGFSVAGYELQRRGDLTAAQLPAMLLASSFSTQTEVMTQKKLQAEQRKVAFVSIDKAHFAQSITPEPEALKTFFDAHIDQYQNPEQVKVAAVTLDREILAQEVEVTDALIEEYYQTHSDRYQIPEERRLAHIMIALSADAHEDDVDAASAKLQEAKASIEAGQAFAEAATAFSEDAGSAEQGGELGQYPRGVLPEAIDEAGFALSEGALSDLVRSESGLHLIKALEILPAKGKTLEEARAEVEVQYRDEQVARMFTERRDEMATVAFESATSLEEVAVVADSEVVELDWFSRDEGEGLAQEAKIRQAAFLEDVLDEGLNSDVIDLADKSVVLRRVDHKPATAKEFDEVAETVKADFIADAADKAMRSAQEAALAALNEQRESLQSLAEQDWTFTQAVDVGRQNNLDIAQEVIDAAFESAIPAAPRTEVFVSASTADTAYIVSVQGRSYPDDIAKPSREELGQARNAEWQALVLALKTQADIQINQEVVDRIFGH